MAGISQVTVMTSQPGRAVVRELEAGLKDSDLSDLRRLLVVQISTQQQLTSGEHSWSPDASSPEDLNDSEGRDQPGTSGTALMFLSYVSAVFNKSFFIRPST